MSDDKKSSFGGEYWRSPFRKSPRFDAPKEPVASDYVTVEADFFHSVASRIQALETAVAALIKENAAITRALRDKQIYPKGVLDSIDRRTI